MIWSISWKNVWRNRKRSLVVIIAVTLGTVAGVFTAGFMKGMVNQRIDTVIHTEVSHVKIHNPNYLLNEEIIYTIPNIEKVEDYLKSNPAIKSYSKRLKVTAMASTSRGNTALNLQGINVADEKSVCQVYEKIVPNGGDFFETEMSNPIVISDKTAELLRIKYYRFNDEIADSLKKLDVDDEVISKLEDIKDEYFKTEKLFKKKLREILSKKENSSFGNEIVKASKYYRLKSKIIFTFNDSNGELCYQTYKVCGIYKTNNSMFDQFNAYVLRKDLSSIAGFSASDFHEIAIITEEETNVKTIKAEIKSNFEDLSVLSWIDLSPEAAMMTQFMDIWYLVIMGIILLALAFGIINTMLMAILERIKELGMLMAIGMNKKRVFKMIMLETIFLTMVGAILGMIIGAFVIMLTNNSGINLSSMGEGLEAIGYPTIIYPTIDAKFFFIVTFMVIITGILSSIIPARKALKLNPIEAIRTE